MKHLDPFALPLESTILIEASAGTGKTYTIETLYLRLLLEGSLGVQQILVVTYTRAATAELRKRIRERISQAFAALCAADDVGDDVLDILRRNFADADSRQQARDSLLSALECFDEAAILTIHSFCQRVLREHAFESAMPFEVEFLADANTLLDEIVADFWANQLDVLPKFWLEALVAASFDRSRLRSLALRAGSDSTTPILAAAGRARDTELQKRWEEAFETLRLNWLDRGETVLELLRESASTGNLNRNSYRPATLVDSWGAEIGREIEAASLGLSVRATHFKNLTTDVLSEKTTKQGNPPEDPFFAICDRFAEVDAEAMQAVEALGGEIEVSFCEFLRAEFPRRKQRAGVQTYDDLLFQLDHALSGPSGPTLAREIRERYRAALIDEFQDTDATQYSILRGIWNRDVLAERSENSGHSKSGDKELLLLIGDPKQAIYAFRGADVFAYLAARPDAGDQLYTLSTNHRSDPRLIQAVNALFEARTKPFWLDGIAFQPATAPDGFCSRFSGGDASLEFLWVPSLENGKGERIKERSKKWAGSELPERIAVEVSRMLTGAFELDGRALDPSDIAILCRTNKQTQAIREALEVLHIPAALLGDSTVLETHEAMELERILRAWLDPLDLRAVRAALSTSIFGLGAHELAALDAQDSGWNEWLPLFRDAQARWHERGFLQAFHAMLREARVYERLLEAQGGERRLTNLLHLGEILERSAREKHEGPLALFDWFVRMRSDEELRRKSIEDEAQLRLESDADAVTVVTIHKSKGLEYPVVICPFLWDVMEMSKLDKTWVRFHDPDDAFRTKLDLGSEQRMNHIEWAAEEGFAEGLRVLYVALTRARHHCSVVWGRIGKAAGASPIAYLLHGAEQGAEVPSLELARSRFESSDDAALQGDLDRLVKNAAGTIAIRDLGEGPGRPRDVEGSLRSLCRREARRRLSGHFRHSSYSALTASSKVRPHPSLRPEDEGLDYDAIGSDEGPPPRSVSGRSIRLDEFPTGAKAGTLIHGLLEEIDFCEAEPARIQPLVDEAMKTAGFEARHSETLCKALLEVIHTPWGDPAELPALADLSKRKRVDELEFLLPVGRRVRDGGNDDQDDAHALRPELLAEVFDRYSDSDLVRDYATQLRSLRFLPLLGYLRGFIDLVCQWQGRYYVIDYKSNHLGSSPLDYGIAALRTPMTDHHYILQYHFYLVALHRHLGCRLASYEYDEHIGGACYLFLRGMAPENPPGCGVFLDRPPKTLIEALSQLLDDPAAFAEVIS